MDTDYYAEEKRLLHEEYNKMEATESRYEAKMWDYVLGRLFEPKREERNEEQDNAERRDK